MKRYLLLLITLISGWIGMHADTYQRVLPDGNDPFAGITETDTYIFVTVNNSKLYVVNGSALNNGTATEVSGYSDYPDKLELSDVYEFQFPEDYTGKNRNIFCVTTEKYWYVSTASLKVGVLGSTDSYVFTIKPMSDSPNFFEIKAVSTSTRALFFQNGTVFKNYATSNANSSGYSKLAIYKKAADDTREAVTLDLSVPTELNVGDTGKATVTATPAVTGITFTSSNEAVATIDADGTITALEAGETTITATYAGDDTHQPASASATIRVIKPIEGNGFTIEFKLGSGSNQLSTSTKASTFVTIGEEYLADSPIAEKTGTVMYATSNYLQFSSSKNPGTLTLKLAKQYIITSVSINGKAVDSGSILTVNGQDYAFTTSYSDVEHSFTSTTPTDELVFSSASGKRVGVQSITIYFSDGTSEDFTDAPEFSVESGEVEAGTKVALTSKTEGAAIYYTTDGTAPTTESSLYTEPITISQTTTIKAIAVKDGLKDSPVAQITYTVVPAYATLAEFIAAAPTTAAILDCPLTVTYYNGKNLYVTDGTTPGFLYSNSLSGSWENGDVIPAGIRGSWDARYNEIVVETESIQEATKGTAVAAQKVENISKDMLHSYVELSNVVISNVSGKSATGTLANAETVAIYNNFGLTLEEGTYASVYGIVNVYNTSSQTGTAGSLQLYPTEMVAVPPTAVAALTISPEFGDIAEGSEITISCDTEGATLSGTIGETTLTDHALPYTYTVTEAIGSKIAVSLKATKESLTDSEFLEGEFTVIERPAFEQVEATFNFADLTSFTSSEPLETPAIGTGTQVENYVLTSGKISISFEKTSGTGVRFWNKGGTTELRVYTNTNMTVKTNSNTASLDMVEFTLNSGSLNLPSDQPGTFTNNVWTAPVEPAAVVSRADNSKVSEVTFGVTSNAQIANMKVTSTEVTTGISNVEMMENAPVIYYNIQGQRVINPAKGQLLIRVQGTNVTKVIL